MSTPPPPPPKPPIRPPIPPTPRNADAVQPLSETRAEAIFNAAVALAESAREEFVAVECRGDEALLERVQVLLAAHADVSEFLDEPQVMPEIEAELVRLKPEEEGERIGRYKLLQQIGVGGFGTVWMAEQMEPVSRKVALKIIKLGMDTKEIIGRFEQERQALAMMDHPNIAKVFDAGATQFGRPFFVMELVKGIPITQYCDETGLGTRERLTLFGDVCSAINHAHQKGIIHRDIKPSNVLITLYADKPVVKVIDFGIAKATQSKLTDKTLFTRFEQFIGTPVYMSPEQAALSAVDIDTRSDIYALGILLYELLTGKAPFDAKTLAEAGYDEMRRIIREVEPPRPSSRLSTVVGEERTTIAKARRVEPEKISRLVEPDLDWIVMKAIEKDRTRRYETANGLKLDIHRFLADEPVNATPPSIGYQFRKFARRNRATLRVAAAIAAVLVGATTVSTWQAIRATRAEHEQARQRHEAELAREVEAKMRRQAEARETIARAMMLFEAGNLDEVEKVMASITPTTLEPTLANADSILFVCKWYAANHRPQEAMEAFRVGLQTNSGLRVGEKNSRIYVELACLLLEVGDTEAYERFQRDILERFGQSADYLLVYRAAQVALLRPSDAELLDKLRSLMERVEAADLRDLGMKSWQMFLVALFEYRHGDYSRAIQFGEETLKVGALARLASCTYALLGASEQRLHHAEKAQLALVKCQQLLDSAPTLRDQPDEYWNDWYDWWTARSLLREAQEFGKSSLSEQTWPTDLESGLAETESAAIALAPSA
jgi:serine/threonine protein kinase